MEQYGLHTIHLHVMYQNASGENQEMTFILMIALVRKQLHIC